MIQRGIEFCRDARSRAALASAVCTDASDLAQHPLGNYVVQCVVRCSNAEQRSELVGGCARARAGRKQGREG